MNQIGPSKGAIYASTFWKPPLCSRPFFAFGRIGADYDCVQRDGALSERLRDRRSAGNGRRDRARVEQRDYCRISIVLAFLFGYGLTMLPLLRTGMGVQRAIGLALASDTASISIMELVDNAVMLAIPGAMTATLSEPLFWGSLVLSLVIAGAFAFPVNRWLISRGKGHAVIHAHHQHH